MKRIILTVVLCMLWVALSAHEVVAYPNPFNEQVTIKIDALKGCEASQVRVSVVDFAGHSYVISSTLDPATGKLLISAPNLPRGSYIIHVSSPAGVFTVKVLKA